MLRDHVGHLRPGRVLELVGAATGLDMEGLVAALGLASVPGGAWKIEDGVLEVSPALFELVAARAAQLAGWQEGGLLSLLVEGYRASCVIRGLLQAGFALKSALQEALRSRGQFPVCSDPVLLWFFGELSGSQCLEYVRAGRTVDPPRHLSSVWHWMPDGVLVDVALRCVSGVRVRFDPFRVELTPRWAAGA